VNQKLKKSNFLILSFKFLLSFFSLKLQKNQTKGSRGGNSNHSGQKGNFAPPEHWKPGHQRATNTKGHGVNVKGSQSNSTSASEGHQRKFRTDQSETVASNDKTQELEVQLKAILNINSTRSSSEETVGTPGSGSIDV
jgi:hypothetical protein